MLQLFLYFSVQKNSKQRWRSKKIRNWPRHFERLENLLSLIQQKTGEWVRIEQYLVHFVLNLFNTTNWSHSSYLNFGQGPVLYGSVSEWIVQYKKGLRKFNNFERLLEQDPTGQIMQVCYRKLASKI
jgi:hypothetical protein